MDFGINWNRMGQYLGAMVVDCDSRVDWDSKRRTPSRVESHNQVKNKSNDCDCRVDWVSECRTSSRVDNRNQSQE